MDNDIQAWNIFNTLAGMDQTKWHDYLTKEKNAEYSATKRYEIPDDDTLVLAEEETGGPFFQYIKKKTKTRKRKKEKQMNQKHGKFHRPSQISPKTNGMII